jgi:hypothetical protein
MPEHFHLLVYSKTGVLIQKFLQTARRSISAEAKYVIERNDNGLRDYCRRHNIDIGEFYEFTAGKSQFRFWKEKPRVIAVLDKKAISKKLDYIHNNPVRRGLVEYPAQWQHSSYHNIVEGKTMALGCHLGQIPS